MARAPRSGEVQKKKTYRVYPPSNAPPRPDDAAKTPEAKNYRVYVRPFARAPTFRGDAEAAKTPAPMPCTDTNCDSEASSGPQSRSRSSAGGRGETRPGRSSSDS